MSSFKLRQLGRHANKKETYSVLKKLKIAETRKNRHGFDPWLFIMALPELPGVI